MPIRIFDSHSQPLQPQTREGPSIAARDRDPPDRGRAPTRCADVGASVDERHHRARAGIDGRHCSRGHAAKIDIQRARCPAVVKLRAIDDRSPRMPSPRRKVDGDVRGRPEATPHCAEVLASVDAMIRSFALDVLTLATADRYRARIRPCGGGLPESSTPLWSRAAFVARISRSRRNDQRLSISPEHPAPSIRRELGALVPEGEVVLQSVLTRSCTLSRAQLKRIPRQPPSGAMSSTAARSNHPTPISPRNRMSFSSIHTNR